MANNKPVYIISDSPEKSSNLFGFGAYAKTIAELIANKKNKTPLVVGVYGQWGSGKTTLMETVRTYLCDSGKYKRGKTYRSCKTIWFQAWKYKDEDEILAALIEEIFRTMKSDGFFDKFKSQIETLIKRFDKSKAIGKFSEIFTGADVSEIFSELEYKKKLGFYDTFMDFFDRLIWTYLNWRPKTSISEKPDDTKGVLVVFIDDLDRCPKDKILKVLETIKLFMDKEGCVFVIGAANEIIEKALQEKYDKEDAGQFMDKIVQVTFNLPQTSLEDCQSFIDEISPDNKEAVSPYLPVIVSALKNNQRRLKRFINNLNLQEGLFKNKGVDVDFAHLLYWNIIDYAYPSLRDDIKENPPTLFILKDVIQGIDEKLPDKERWDIPKELLDNVLPSLQGYIQKKDVVRIIREFKVNREQLDELITFCRIVESTEEAREKGEGGERVEFGKMVEIPAGKFLYGEEKHEEIIEEPFLIDVYPVTNRQYEKFMKVDGYLKNEYWSEEGIK